ncbi:MAG TPA: hypothetical protein EYQ18_25265 [Candidatus Handelsmanbacteria bacterium]|nr:hypothetical protein [Candidatus Handelsmanbacteria bacterium]
MTTNCKIVIVGIGSASFGPKTLTDIFIERELAGSTLCLVDINSEALNAMGQLANKVVSRLRQKRRRASLMRMSPMCPNQWPYPKKLTLPP